MAWFDDTRYQGVSEGEGVFCLEERGSTISEGDMSVWDGDDGDDDRYTKRPIELLIHHFKFIMFLLFCILG